jgi:hypothetical protein
VLLAKGGPILEAPAAERTWANCGANVGYPGGGPTKQFQAALLLSLAISSKLLPSERCLLAGQVLPALYNHIDVLRVQFRAAADALGKLRSRQRGATAKEGFIDQLSAFCMVQNRALHQLDRLLGWVIELLLVAAAHDKLR